MKNPNPIKQLIVDGFVINNKTTYEEVDKLDIDSIRWAFFEYQHHVYPTTMMLYMQYNYPKSVVEITASNHKKFDVIKKEMPYTFDCVGTPEHIHRLKIQMNLFHEIGSKEHQEYLEYKKNCRTKRKTQK